MKMLCLSSLLTLLPLLLMAQWNTNLSENLQIADAGGQPFVFYSDGGYYFAYDENVVYKVNRYNTDGTPLWATPILPNNHTIGTATFTKYALLDPSGNLIHVSSIEEQGAISYCITKIDKNGNQLWNGATGIVVSGFAIGAYLSPTNHLYVATDSNILLKYDANGTLVSSVPFASSNFGNTINAEIVEKSDGAVGVIFLRTLGNPVYGNYYYTGVSNTGVATSPVAIQTELCRFFTSVYSTTDGNDNILFFYTDQNDKGYIQKITGNTPVFSGNGFEIDEAANHASIFEAAHIKNNKLYVLYNYYEIVNGNTGILSQTIDLSTFTRSFPTGNILFDCNTTNMIAPRNGLISHDDKLGFLALNKANKHIGYHIFDDNGLLSSTPVCTSPTEKAGRAVLSTLNNISTTASQIVVFFADDRNANFDNELYAQNLLFNVTATQETAPEIANATLYPNPVTTTLQLLTPTTALAGAAYRIHDIWGRTVLTGNYTQNSIDVATLTTGVYFIQFYTEGKKASQTIRFVKQ